MFTIILPSNEFNVSDFVTFDVGNDVGFDVGTDVVGFNIGFDNGFVGGSSYRVVGEDVVG